MTQTRTFSALVAAAGVAVALMAGSAQARDVNWSVGIGVPGVVVGASNGFYAPAPVYVAPPPVYYAPPRPVYYAPPAYYAPPVVHYGHRPHRHHHHHHHHGHGHRHGHDRWDR